LFFIVFLQEVGRPKWRPIERASMFTSVWWRYDNGYRTFL